MPDFAHTLGHVPLFDPKWHEMARVARIPSKINPLRACHGPKRGVLCMACPLLVGSAGAAGVSANLMPPQGGIGARVGAHNRLVITDWLYYRLVIALARGRGGGLIMLMERGPHTRSHGGVVGLALARSTPSASAMVAGARGEIMVCGDNALNRVGR